MFSSPQKGFIQHHFSKKKSGAGFTLIELLVVIGILAVLATTTALILNPAELLAKARDANRVSDLNALNKNIDIYSVQGGAFFGNSNTVYISLPDNGVDNDSNGIADDCDELGLPTLPSSPAWRYKCVSASSGSLMKTDGSGWVPIDLSSTPSISPARLPVDPVNSVLGGRYYSYIGGSWELNGVLESKSYKQSSVYLPNFPGVIALGSNLSLSPLFNTSGLVGYWPMDGDATDSSGNGSDGVLGGPVLAQFVSSDLCKVGSCLQFDGLRSYINLPYNTNLSLTGSSTISFWQYLDTNPDTDGSGGVNEYRYLFKKAGSSSPFYMYLEQSRTFNFTVIKGGRNYRYVGNSFGSTQFPTNQWIHFAFTYDSATGQGAIYRDGVVNVSGIMADRSVNPAVLINAGAAPYNLDSNTAAWRMGNDPGAVFPTCCGSIPGKIDDLRIYNRALSASEIQAIYNATK